MQGEQRLLPQPQPNIFSLLQHRVALQQPHIHSQMFHSCNRGDECETSRLVLPAVRLTMEAVPAVMASTWEWISCLDSSILFLRQAWDAWDRETESSSYTRVQGTVAGNTFVCADMKEPSQKQLWGSYHGDWLWALLTSCGENKSGVFQKAKSFITAFISMHKNALEIDREYIYQTCCRLVYFTKSEENEILACSKKTSV